MTTHFANQKEYSERFAVGQATRHIFGSIRATLKVRGFVTGSSLNRNELDRVGDHVAVRGRRANLHPRFSANRKGKDTQRQRLAVHERYTLIDENGLVTVF